VSAHNASRPVSATFSQADTALYRAKQNGRDQVRLFGAEPASDHGAAPVPTGC
jgi:PleD family two-component response regulator